jgi:hypothetical protein
MKIYELIEVSSKPTQKNFRYTDIRVYSNALYLEAECNVDCMDLEEEPTEEEYNQLVIRELTEIIETLKTFGRYPTNGIPKFVAY